MISHVLRRAKQIPSVDQVVLATDFDSIGPLPEIGQDHKVTVYPSHPEPLARYVDVVRCMALADTDYVVRITGDCPGLDPEVSGRVVRLALDNDIPYAANVLEWPDGIDTECFTVGWLKLANEWAQDDEREHVTPWMRDASMWGCPEGTWELSGGPGRDYKWSVDTEEDLEYVRELYAALGKDWGYREALAVEPGAVCALCSEGVPHTQRSLTSIGGVRDYVVYDLHDQEVSGGVAPAECTAWQIVKRRAQAISPTS
jgi:spore coat polysaccharide biosynthesis protein SpsF (cytidylyltransferase family)